MKSNSERKFFHLLLTETVSVRLPDSFNVAHLISLRRSVDAEPDQSPLVAICIVSAPVAEIKDSQKSDGNYSIS